MLEVLRGYSGHRRDKRTKKQRAFALSKENFNYFSMELPRGTKV